MLKVHLVYEFVFQNPVLLFLYTELNQWINHEKEVLAELVRQHGIEWEQKALEEKRQMEQMPTGSIHERLAWGAGKSEMENQQCKKNKTKNRGMEL